MNNDAASRPERDEGGPVVSSFQVREIRLSRSVQGMGETTTLEATAELDAGASNDPSEVARAFGVLALVLRESIAHYRELGGR